MKYRFLLQMSLYVVAFLLFYLGLGVGLTQSPTGGTALWIVAFVIAGCTTWWRVRTKK